MVRRGGISNTGRSRWTVASTYGEHLRLDEAGACAEPSHSETAMLQAHRHRTTYGTPQNGERIEKVARGDMEEKEFYVAKEVAWLLGVTPRTVLNMVKQGRLTGRAFGKRLRFRHDDIMTLAKKSKVRVRP